MASSVLTTPCTPSVFDPDPRSPNSWTARSFTTLLPSDSPSQAMFPKHSQASLLLAARTDNTHTVRPPAVAAPLVLRQHRQVSFAKRNLHFILAATLLQVSMIVLTALLVLIITAATSDPRKHIHPSYYLGVMLSIATSVASIILIYIKYKGRQKSSANEVPFSPTSNYNTIELGHIPSPFPVTTASAQLAGSNNRHRDAEGVNIATEHEPYTQQRQPHQQDQQENATSTAAAIQRFLENELKRQERVKRRIRTWLRGVPPSLPVQSPSSFPPPRVSSLPNRQQRVNPLRLAELDQEIENYLGFPAPTLYIAEAGKEVEATKELDKDIDTVHEIDYEKLPPAIPRPGARGRKPMLSDPITVLHVGPMRGMDSPLVKKVEESISNSGGPMKQMVSSLKEVRGAANANSTTATSSPPPPRPRPRPPSSRHPLLPLTSKQSTNSLAEKWLKKMIRGVDVETRLGPAVAVDGKRRKSKRWSL
ncbi:MAG: hypothetical protein Q9221_000761 [Calogaya cf. arnoldii]